jgi:hypothetical protein
MPMHVPLTCGDTRRLRRRSQNLMIPPLLVRQQVRGPFSLPGERAFGVRVNEMSTRAASGQSRTSARADGFRVPALTAGSSGLTQASGSWVPRASERSIDGRHKRMSSSEGGRGSTHTRSKISASRGQTRRRPSSSEWISSASGGCTTMSWGMTRPASSRRPRGSGKRRATCVPVRRHTVGSPSVPANASS